MRSERSTAKQSPTESITRRHFCSFVGLGALSTASMGSGVAFVQYASPNVLFEPAISFKAGSPDGYGQGVDERWKQKQKVWIVTTNDGLYALVAICTHLGCTPNWVAEEGTFRCPCHGSVFSVEGDVLAGPAPVPLYRAPVHVDETGELVVGTGLLGYGRPEQENRPEERSAPTYVVKV